MKLSTIFGVIGLCGFAQAKNYLLVPKNHHVYSFNFLSFAQEHKLDVHTEIGDLVVYKTSMDNYNTYSSTLNELFDVEEDGIVSLPKPVEGEAKEPVFFVQTPGDSQFQIMAPAAWHLNRVAQRDLPLKDSYPYSEPGSCHKNKDAEIHTYVVDTGIDVEHPEFEGRATWLGNFAGDDEDTDCNSHGTHCAGLVGSKSYGVCKDAKLFAIKVLNCEGSGSFSGILEGLQFVYKRHLEQSAKNPKLRSIISMSLGGGFSRTINRAVEALLKSDSMYVVVAAGNEDSDACQTSPASAKGVLTIMASDKYDNRAYFSNYGQCADLYSPGVDILSTVPGGKTAVYSGTSMATPNLVGVLNHYLDQHPELNMAQVKKKMMDDATKNHLKSNPKQTNNLLVYLNREN